MIRNASLAVVFTLACSLGLQAQAPPTALSKQLERVDFAISGAGIFNRSVSGPVLPAAAPNVGETLSDSPSNTVGALVQLRYIAKPYIGVELNFTYGRYTQNYSYTPFGVQSNADEYTLGYVVQPRQTLFGLQPFASVGAGTTKFSPTRGGGQNLSTQGRATYYYSLGVQQEIFSHIGVRASFRQAFFLAPDYGQNYLTILKHSSSSEPTLGFYARF